MTDRKQSTRHMEKATLYAPTSNFVGACEALKLAVWMDLDTPKTIDVNGKSYTVSITYANAWKVVENIKINEVRR